MDLPRLLPKATLKPAPYIERPSGDDKYDLRSKNKNKTQQSETHPEVPQADDVVFSLEDIVLTNHRQ